MSDSLYRVAHIVLELMNAFNKILESLLPLPKLLIKLYSVLRYIWSAGPDNKAHLRTQGNAA